jgi:hypothetical protein
MCTINEQKTFLCDRCDIDITNDKDAVFFDCGEIGLCESCHGHWESILMNRWKDG